MEPVIDEPWEAGRVGCLWSARRIGNHARDPKFLKNCTGLRAEPRPVARLQSDFSVWIQFAEQCEKIPGTRLFKTLTRWKLEEDGLEFPVKVAQFI